MPSHLPNHRGHLIGLDIGSHAVRAVELTVSGGQPTLKRYAQVALPPGAVGDGEVVDAKIVGDALKRLWAEGRFSHKRVVVGVSSQRAIVRLADVPAMSDPELRTALKFEVEDLIPIPVEEAVLDFTTIEPNLPAADPADPHKMRILLVAAQRDMVNGHLGALKAAGLKPVAVDSVALALLRAVPSERSPGPGLQDARAPLTEAVVAVGAGSTTVAIREDGIPRFVRVLNIGGDDLVAGLASETGTVIGAHESSRPTGGPFAPVATLPSLRGGVASPIGVLVDEIRGSLDFYLAQADTDRVDRIVATGGGALTVGLLPVLQDALRQTVELANPLATVTIGKTGLTDEQLKDAAPYLVTPIGLALWGSAAGRQISLLPEEVFKAIRQRRHATILAMAVVAFGVTLGLLWAARSTQVAAANGAARRAEGQITTLQRQVTQLSDITTVEAKVKSSQQLYGTVLIGDVDWVRLVEQVTTVMPADVHLTTLTVTRSTGQVAATPGAPSPGDGTITFSGIAQKGPDSVANWLRALETVPGLSGATVQNLAQAPNPVGGTGSGGTTFSSSATVTKSAESQRAPKGTASS